MQRIYHLLILLWIFSLLPQSDLATYSKTDVIFPPSRRPFGAIINKIDESRLSQAIAHMVPKINRKTIVFTNEAESWIRLWCASGNHDTGEHFIVPGQSMLFSYETRVSGRIAVLWCTLQYNRYWASWNAYDDISPNVNKKGRTFHYSIRMDGVYINEMKITGLGSGEHRYIMWSHYNVDKKPHGEYLIGFVDSGVCNNVPGWMLEKVSVVTLCDYHCVIVYEHLHCEGANLKLEGSKRCTDLWLTSFNDKTSSVKGC